MAKRKKPVGDVAPMTGGGIPKLLPVPPWTPDWANADWEVADGGTDDSATTQAAEVVVAKTPRGFCPQRFGLGEFKRLFPQIMDLSDRQARDLISKKKVPGVKRAQPGYGYWLSLEAVQELGKDPRFSKA